MDDDYIFCPRCGADTSVSSQPANYEPGQNDPDITGETELLNTLRSMFKAESLAWRIAGIVMLVACVIGIISAAAACLLPDSGSAVSLPMPPAYYLVTYLLGYLPISIVNIVMAPRAARYMNTLYTDARPAVKRCSSVGMIVLGALFNAVAMVFIIIKFVQVKSNAGLIDRIISRQQGS